MEVIIIFKDGWACSHEANQKETILGENDKGEIMMRQYLDVNSIFFYSGSLNPNDACQVLTENGNGFFCIFESNQKLKITKNMNQDEVTELKNNLKKWQKLNK